MTAAEKIVKTLLEAEPDEFIKTRHRVRDQQRLTDHYFRVFGTSFGKPNVDTGQDVAFTSGSRRFDREDGVWWETKRTKNPEYFALPRYFWMAPGPGKLAFIVVKMPRALSDRLWRSAAAAIYKDATGQSWENVTGARRGQDRQRVVIDAADESDYNSRLSGKRREPTYEIFPDGKWKRTAN